jgi:DNA recombination protein RmuC
MNGFGLPEFLLLIVMLGLAGVTFYLVIRLSRLRQGTDPSLAELKKKNEDLQSENSGLKERASLLSQQVSDLQKNIELKETMIRDLTGQIKGKIAEFEGLQAKFNDQKNDIEKLQTKFNTEFQNLANKILEDNSKKFTEQNRTKLDEILKPLGEKIRDFEKKVEETYDKESKQRFSLEKEIIKLGELNQQISKEASNLTTALKGQAKTRGNWGEIILESILEKSGLVRDREYFIQQSFTNTDGRRLQPDVIVSYPGERNVVIDSKVSLIAYEQFASAETKEEQEVALKEHLNSIRNHINDLSGKKYQDLYQLKSLDFVMLFMPIEPAYFVAMQSDPNLWNYAYDRRILLISPTNLIAALQMIANLWRVEYQNRNVQDIADQSGALYEKFVGLVNDLLDIGKKLEGTRSSYDDAMNKLSTGKGNLIRRVEKIKELGVKTNKEIPKSLLDKMDDD